jgi:hypothetical protein
VDKELTLRLLMLGQLDPALHAILKQLNKLNAGEDKLVVSLHQDAASDEELKPDMSTGQEKLAASQEQLRMDISKSQK